MSVDRSIPSQDLYRELEVDPGASTEAIEAAYRSLMMQHHPDRAGPGGLARSKRLNLARDWLVDGDRRARYDATRSKPRTEVPGSASHSPPPAGSPRSGRPSTRHPLPPKANQAHPRRTRALSPVGSTLRLGLVGVVAVVAALLVVTAGWPGSGGARPASPGPLGAVTSTATIRPTPHPTPGPTATRTPGPTPSPTSEPTPGPTPGPSAAPAGRADIRLSGMHAEHYDQALGGTSGCSTTTAPGSSKPKLTGFEIESDTRSGSRWQLTLADLTVSWSMDIFFEATADDLWWNSGVGVGSVTRTADGFAFDVVMTDSVQSEHAKGTVTCR